MDAIGNTFDAAHLVPGKAGPSVWRLCPLRASESRPGWLRLSTDRRRESAAAVGGHTHAGRAPGTGACLAAHGWKCPPSAPVGARALSAHELALGADR